MSHPYVSPKFDMDDIRRIRDFNSERHKNMTGDELHEELKVSTKTFIERLKATQEQPSA